MGMRLRGRAASGRGRLQRVVDLHLAVALERVAVELLGQVLVEDGEQNVPEGLSPHHPLVVVPAPVVVGSVEARAGHTGVEPSEQGLGARMHPEGHMRLSTVAPEVPLTDEDSDEDAQLEVRQVVHLAVAASCHVLLLVKGWWRTPDGRGAAVRPTISRAAPTDARGAAPITATTAATAFREAEPDPESSGR